jgi:hypothetical protein
MRHGDDPSNIVTTTKHATPTDASTMTFSGDLIFSSYDCPPRQCSRSAASKSSGGKIAKARLGSTSTTGIIFSRSAGTPEVEGRLECWISDFRWMSTGPTILTPRCTVESLQASLEALVCHCSKPCLFRGEVMFFESLWLVPKWNRIFRCISSVSLLTTLSFLRVAFQSVSSRQCFTSNKRGVRSAEFRLSPRYVQQNSTSQ